ncbi:hypothetical protein AC579_4313 [Pseudocercospora musae]|uniref:Uncharacterized protein n=1 Tax=Pseudocercospora musae TaxID=113226 RepID=A0A139IQM5_9PEZI|nr:hypothetical protein AC579_4313 [Pseudocercospora musae]
MASSAAAAAADSPTLGAESPDSMVRKTQQLRPKPAVTNFSRPRIYKTSSGKTYQEGDTNVKSVNAYYEQEDDDDTETETDGSIHRDRNTGDPPMPSEPRFSPLAEEDNPLPREPRFSTSPPPPPTQARFSVETFDLEPSDSNKPNNHHTAGGGSSPIISRTEAFLKPRKGSALLRTEDQRHPGGSSASTIAAARNNNNSSTTSNDSSEEKRAQTSSSSASSTTPLPLKSILKRTSVQVTSERAWSFEEEGGGGEDTRSHHTVSEDGSGGAYGKWHSSDYDTSGLSEKQIKKLERKGVNPALYAEMKAARGSGKVIGALTGNSYVS